MQRDPRLHFELDTLPVGVLPQGLSGLRLIQALLAVCLPNIQSLRCVSPVLLLDWWPGHALTGVVLLRVARRR